MQITQFVRQATTLNPLGTATIYGERRRSWTEFAERTARLAAALKKLGLATDDFVAVLSMNSDRYVELFYAIPHAGGCFAPFRSLLDLNPRSSVGFDLTLMSADYWALPVASLDRQ